MGRRGRRTRTELKPLPFHAAFTQIDRMEMAVFYRTVSKDFTVNDVSRWLWPAYICNALSDAYNYIKTSDRTTANDKVAIPDGPDIEFYLNVADGGMCAPAPGQIKLQDTERAPTIMAAIREIEAVHYEFEAVRACVNWCNDNMTPGAARYYFPSLGALLPPDHPFHQASGERYREPTQISYIANTMRRATTIIAKGLLCDPAGVHNEAVNFRVNVIHKDGGKSAQFFII